MRTSKADDILRSGGGMNEDAATFLKAERRRNRFFPSHDRIIAGRYFGERWQSFPGHNAPGDVIFIRNLLTQTIFDFLLIKIIK